MFLTSGGMAKSASVAYKRLASLLARKRDQLYSLVIAWLRCHLVVGQKDGIVPGIMCAGLVNTSAVLGDLQLTVSGHRQVLHYTELHCTFIWKEDGSIDVFVLRLSCW